MLKNADELSKLFENITQYPDLLAFICSEEGELTVFKDEELDKHYPLFWVEYAVAIALTAFQVAAILGQERHMAALRPHINWRQQAVEHPAVDKLISNNSKCIEYLVRPYYVFERKERLSYSLEQNVSYTCERIFDISKAKELGPNIIYNLLAYEMNLPSQMSKLLQKTKPPTLNLATTAFFQKKPTLIVSLAEIDKLNITKEMYEFALSQLDTIKEQTLYLLKHGYKLGIDFSETYLVSAGSPPPASYRSGIDVITADENEYKTLTNKLSYIVGKEILRSIMERAHYTCAATLPELSLSNCIHISDNFFLKDETLKINNVAYFTDVNVASMVLKGKPQHLGFRLLIMGFDTTVPPKEIDVLASSTLFKDKMRVITLIFYNPLFSEDTKRKEAHDSLLLLVKKHKVAARLHVLLLTDKAIQAPFRDIAQSDTVSNNGFIRCKDKKAYQLCSTAIEQARFNNIRQHSVTDSRPFITNSLPLLPKPLPKRIANYRFGKSNDRRASKKICPMNLKVQPALSIDVSAQRVNAKVKENEAQLSESQSNSHSVDQSNSAKSRQTNAHAHSNTAYFNWASTDDIYSLSEKVKRHAKKTLAEYEAYDFNYGALYLYSDTRHLSKTEHLQKLIENDDYRLAICAKAFGMVCIKNSDGKQELLSLPGYSVNAIGRSLATYLSKHLVSLHDGFYPRDCTFAKAMLNTTYLKYDNTRTIYSERQQASLVFSRYAMKKTPNVGSYLTPLEGAVLLDSVNLQTLSKDKRNALLTQSSLLLEVLENDISIDEKKIISLEQTIVDLFLVRLNKIDDKISNARHSDKKISTLMGFIVNFSSHTTHNLKILTYFLLYGTNTNLLFFIDLLSHLHDCQLLELCYDIFFTYSSNISALHSYCSSKNKGQLPAELHCLDLVLSAATPLDCKSHWSPKLTFYVFCIQRALLENTFFDTPYIKDGLPKLWDELNRLCLKYTNNCPIKTAHLMALFVDNISRSPQLSAVAVSRLSTFMNSLSALLKHAADNQVLEEQLTEIAGLSYQWTDVFYAITHNKFIVVCKEMEIAGGDIDTKTKSYNISKASLIAMCSSPPGVYNLKRDVFRYLGKTPLRHKIAYYRKLYQLVMHGQALAAPKNSARETKETKTMSLATPNLGNLLQINVCFYIISTTGRDFECEFTKEQLIERHRKFIADTKIEHYYNYEAINLSLASLFSALNSQALQALLKPQHTGGDSSLWSIWNTSNELIHLHQQQALPPIITRRFKHEEAITFLLQNDIPIRQFLQSISQSQQYVNKLLDFILKSYPSLKDSKEFFLNSKRLLAQVFPALSSDNFFGHLTQIHSVLSFYATLINGCECDPYTDYLELIFKAFTPEQATTLLAIMNHCLLPGNPENEDKTRLVFLTTLAHREMLLKNIVAMRPLLEVVIQHSLPIAIRFAQLTKLFALCEQAAALENNDSALLINVVMSHLKTPEGEAFLELATKRMTILQAVGACKLIQQTNQFSLSYEFIRVSLLANATHDFSQSYSAVSHLSSNQLKPIMRIMLYLSNETALDTSLYINKLTAYTSELIDNILSLIDVYTIEPKRLAAILNHPFVQQAIDDYLQNQYTQNTQRFIWDKLEVKNDIEQICLKHGRTIPLLGRFKQQLFKDYRLLMAYLSSQPVLIDDINAVGKTISELSQSQLKDVFNSAKKHLSGRNTANSHRHKVLLLALSSEALFRTTRKFPRRTQLLAALTTVNMHCNIIHEIETGEGKSLIAALTATLLVAAGNTVDIVTENMHLASVGQRKFKRVYQYLGIPCGNEIIEATSDATDYMAQGVNYSTPASLALFKAQAKLNKTSLPTHCALICDEVDATLTSTVQYRLSASLNGLYANKQLWRNIYQHLLCFVADKKLFIDNQCSQTDDIYNLLQYLLINSESENETASIKSINEAIFSTLIESAMVAISLEEDKDFVVIADHRYQDCFMAAPILEHTKRPDKRVSYSDGIQQLLHVRLQTENKIPGRNFSAEPISQTIIEVSAKNFFDDYRLKHGPLIGFSGTTGTPFEREEFYLQNDFLVFTHPRFHPNRSEHCGLIAGGNNTQQMQAVAVMIRANAQRSPGQPVLVITSSPQKTRAFSEYFRGELTQCHVQDYIGLEAMGICEDDIINRAGLNNTLTVATQSMARGTDVMPAHPAGLFVINTCADITADELRQIEGRAGRNSLPGKHATVLNLSELNTTSCLGNDDVSMAAAFKASQLALSLTRQRTRLERRLQEEVRYLIVNDYFLPLRCEADAILCRQFGKYSSLVPETEFNQALATFNSVVDKRYKALLTEHGSVNAAFRYTFINDCVDNFQQFMQRWLGGEQQTNLKVIEPAVALENGDKLMTLRDTQIVHLFKLSTTVSAAWRHVGHQPMQQLFAHADISLKIFEPYFQKRCSFKHAVIDAGVKHNVLTSANALAALQSIQSFTNDFLNACFYQLDKIPLLNRFIPKQAIASFCSTYIETLEQQLKDANWDAIALPRIDMTKTNRVMSAINSAFAIAGIAQGPTGYIVSKIIMPAFKKIIISILKTSNGNIAQLLVGIDSISAQLTGLVNFLLTAGNNETLNIIDLIDTCLPLIENPVLIKLLTHILTQQGMANRIPAFLVLPDLIRVVRHHLLQNKNKPFTPTTLLTLCKYGLMLDGIKALLQQSDCHYLLTLCEYDDNSLSHFASLDFYQFQFLLRMLAHPNFNDCLIALPGELRFGEMMDLLNSKQQFSLPPIETLKDYQQNHDRLAEQAQARFSKLKVMYSLSADNVNSQLERLRHQHTGQRVLAEHLQLKKANAITGLHWSEHAIVGVSIIILATINYALFCIPLVIASVCGVMSLCYNHYKKYQKSTAEAKKIAAEQALLAKPLPPIASQQQQSFACLHQHPSNLATNNQEQAPASLGSPPVKRRKAGSNFASFTLFSAKAKPEAANAPLAFNTLASPIAAPDNADCVHKLI